MTERYYSHEIVGNFPQPSVGKSLLIAVHEDPGYVNGAVAAEGLARDWTLLALNRDIAGALVSVPVSDRGRTAETLIQARISAEPQCPIVLVDIDLLFSPVLGIDALQLFVNASRFRPLVVAWPGSWDGRILTYALPEHGHYRLWQRPAADVRNLY